MKQGLFSGFDSYRDASPGRAFLLLLFLVALGLTLSSAISFVLIAVIWSYEPTQLSALLADPALPQSKPLLMLSQFVSSLGVFVLPSLIFLRMRGCAGEIGAYSTRYLFKAGALSIIVMVVQAPLIDFTASFNESLNLTGLSADLQSWMLETERKAKVLTDVFLEMHTTGDLLLALLIMAVVPAIGEELLFRAGMLPLFIKAFGNKHLAIWFTAFLFSFIHFQFFGFLPRFLLGALLGYLFTEGGSVFFPVMAHFGNNALAVLSAFPAFAGMQPMLGFTGISAAIVSFVLAVAGVFLLRRMNMRETSSFTFGG